MLTGCKMKNDFPDLSGGFGIYKMRTDDLN